MPAVVERTTHRMKDGMERRQQARQRPDQAHLRRRKLALTKQVSHCTGSRNEGQQRGYGTSWVERSIFNSRESRLSAFLDVCTLRYVRCYVFCIFFFEASEFLTALLPLCNVASFSHTDNHLLSVFFVYHFQKAVETRWSCE